MAAPTVTLTADKAAYAIGQPIVLTMTYSDPDAKTITFVGSSTDAEGNVGQGSVTVSIGQVDQSKNKVTATGYVCAKQSDSGAIATFTTTA